MTVLKRVAKYGGPWWEQAVYVDSDFKDPDEADPEVVEETVVRYISNALDILGVDHVIHGGFPIPSEDDVRSPGDFYDWIDAGDAPFTARDSNLWIAERGVGDEGRNGGSVCWAGCEDVNENIDWVSAGGDDIHEGLQNALTAIGANMGFPTDEQYEEESPGTAEQCGSLWMPTPMADPMGYGYTNLCGEEVPEFDGTFGARVHVHTYNKDCVRQHMEFADKESLQLVGLQSGQCIQRQVGPSGPGEANCRLRAVGPRSVDPSAVTIDSCSFGQTTVEPGDTVTFNTTVSNGNSQPANVEVEFLADGTLVAVSSETVAAGATAQISSDPITNDVLRQDVGEGTFDVIVEKSNVTDA